MILYVIYMILYIFIYKYENDDIVVFHKLLEKTSVSFLMYGLWVLKVTQI